jgi:hypothetical protein
MTYTVSPYIWMKLTTYLDGLEIHNAEGYSEKYNTKW